MAFVRFWLIIFNKNLQQDSYLLEKRQSLTVQHLPIDPINMCVPTYIQSRNTSYILVHLLAYMIIIDYTHSPSLEFPLLFIILSLDCCSCLWTRWALFGLFFGLKQSKVNGYLAMLFHFRNLSPTQLTSSIHSSLSSYNI